MSNPWDKPKRNYVKSSRVTLFNGSWRDVNWAELYRECKEVEDEAVAFAEEANVQRYREWIDKKERELADLNPESGAYEGNLSDEYPFKALTGPKLMLIRSKANLEIIERFVDRYQFKSFATQLMTDIIKHISIYKLTTLDGEDYSPQRLQAVPLDQDGRPAAAKGQISARSLVKSLLTDETMRGLYRFLMLDSRSCYLEKQYTSPNKSWCALVPLIMSAFKIHKGVPYSHWNKGELIGIVNPKLYSAMTWQPEEISRDTIIEARTQGLLIKTGKGQGDYRNPVHTFKLYGTTGLSELPEYVQTMLAQIWCAHPNNRTKYMILDWVNWDKIPAELIDTEVISFSKPAVKDSPYIYNSEPSDLPWDV